MQNCEHGAQELSWLCGISLLAKIQTKYSFLRLVSLLKNDKLATEHKSSGNIAERTSDVRSSSLVIFIQKAIKINS